MHLSISDIERLAGDTSTQARAEIAGKVAATLSAGVFNERERTLALDILNVLVRDVELQVRKQVALNLRDSLNIPVDLVRQLACDVDEVSVPLLRYSYALSEEDLIDLVRSTRELTKLVAIASRDSISEGLTEALLDTEVKEVMRTVFANKGAVVRDEHMMKRWSMIAGDRSLLEVLVHRGGLSVAIAEKLYAVVSDEMKSKLSKMYRLPMVIVEEATDDLREWVTLGLMNPGDVAPSSEHELEKLINNLYLSNRLTYSLVIRSLCIGDTNFFEAALAKLAGIPRSNARILLFDSGKLGFKAIYEKARMPEGFYEAIRMLLKISLEETSYGRYRLDDFRNRVIARVQAEGYDTQIENMQYLLTIIGGKIATAATLH